MTEQRDTFEVRDLREKDFFVVDDKYLNGWAKVCGIYATGVYFVLCRHANSQTQTCFPSVSLISEKLSISQIQVKRALKVLEGHNIVKVARTAGKVNVYYLVDKKHWTTGISQIPAPVSDRYPKYINRRIRKKEPTPFPSDAPAYRLSAFLLKSIKDRHPEFKEPNLQAWARHMDLLLRVDGREEQDVAAVIEWCQSDPFWQSNVLSAEKLRKQYDRLFMKMEGAKS